MAPESLDAAMMNVTSASCSAGDLLMDESSLIIVLLLVLALIITGLLLSRGYMQFKGMARSSAQLSTRNPSAAVLSQERPQTPEREPTPASDELETDPMMDYAQPSTSAAVLSQERPQTPGREPTPATDELETDPMMDYAQPSTSAAVLSQERPQTPGREPTPASDELETDPMMDYAQPSTSAAVLSQERPQTPGREPTPASDELETDPMVDYAQPSTSAAVLSQERPQTPGREPTPASDELDTDPMVDYAQPSTSAAVLSQERPQTPEREPTSASDELETDPMMDYAQPSTSAAVLSQERPQTPGREPTPASDELDTDPMVDYAQPSTSAAVLSQERPQTPEREPTPATDELETDPMMDYAQPSTSAAVLSQERPQTPGREPTPATDELETDPMVDYAQPSTSAAVLSQERPQTPGREPTQASDELETDPMVDYAQPSTSAAVLSQERPQTPEREPTPASDELETDPMMDYAQPSTSAAVLSEGNPSSPTDGPVKINPTGSFDSFYELGKKLASRSHGIVHEGIRRSDDKQVIIKFVKKRRFDFHIGHSGPVCREAAIMRIMKHSDHVLKLYEWFDMGDQNILIMEHPGTSITLCDFIQENGGRLTEAAAKDIMQNLTAALRHCSEQGVYYKDMSLRKVLIDPCTMQIKLTGFHRALTIRERQTGKLKSVAERRIHALMATNDGLYRVLKRMVEGKCLLDLKLWFGWKNTRLSKEYQDLLWKLRDRESGITVQNIVDHDWFEQTPGTDALEADGESLLITTLIQGRPRLAAVKRGIQTLISKVCPDGEPSQERPHTPGREPTPAEPTDLDSMFPHELTLQHKYFQSLYKVGKKLRYDDRVYEGIRRSDGQKVDIKFVERCRLWEASPEFVEEGATLLKMQKPPTCDHFVRLYERFILEDRTILIMEHLPGYVTLREFMRRNGEDLTEDTENRIINQAYVALRHCVDNHLHYPLLRRLMLINPKTLQIKYAHLPEKDFKRIDETDEDSLFELAILLMMENHKGKDIPKEHLPDAKTFLTRETFADHPFFA